MAQSLRHGVDELSLTTRVTLAVLATASGVYTYLGVRDLLDGTATLTFFGAIIYSAAVSVGIYAFWAFLIRFVPHIKEAHIRRKLYGAMVLGAMMIVAMSSWLNAAALAGSAALEQHMAEAAEDYAKDLDQAHNNALASQSLLPDIQLAAERFARLSREEQTTGALTGTSGSGTVARVLAQMSAQLTALADEVSQDRTAVAGYYEEGGKHLSAMRHLVSATGAVAPRGDAFAEEAVALTGVIAAMQQTSIAPAVKRAADGLVRSFITPVADGDTQDLRARQTLIVGKVADAVKEEAQALSAAADEILTRQQVEPKRFDPISKPEAVIRYATDFLPSWAGAISIDLMPAVLVLILTIVQIAIRQDKDPEIAAHRVTAADMIEALQLYDRVKAVDARGHAQIEPVLDTPQRASGEDRIAADDVPDKPLETPNVTSLAAKADRLPPGKQG